MQQAANGAFEKVGPDDVGVADRPAATLGGLPTPPPGAKLGGPPAPPPPRRYGPIADSCAAWMQPSLGRERRGRHRRRLRVEFPNPSRFFARRWRDRPGHRLG